MDIETETEMLTQRLYEAVLGCPHGKTKNFLVLRRDILQDHPENTEKQLYFRLRREIKSILAGVYKRK